jgi:hypothetical protein
MLEDERHRAPRTLLDNCWRAANAPDAERNIIADLIMAAAKHL